jgi:AsmA protein
VEGVSAQAAWPHGGRDLFAHLTGLIGGEVAELHIEGPSLVDLTRSEGSPVLISAVLGGNWLSYRGRLVKAPDIVAAGALEASLPSAKGFLHPLAAASWPSWLPDTALHVGGQVFVTSRGISFENAQFTIGRSQFAGGMSLRVTADGRPSLSGTIATTLVELDDLSSARPDQIAVPDLALLPDLDLRMSARRVRVGGTRLDEIAAGLILADRRLDLTVSQGVEGGASAKLHVVATPDASGISIRAQAASDSIDVGSVLSGFSPRPALTGMGSFNLSLESRGENLGALQRALSGKAILQMKKGTLSLPAGGAEPTGSVVAENPPVASLPAPVARRFTEANLAGALERGVLIVTEGWIGEGTSQIAVDGKVDVADRSMDLSFSGPGEAHTDAPWRLRATGPWSAPTVWRQPPDAK